MRVRWLTIACVILINFPAFAQVFGGNPASLKWRQINTPVVRVIFPQGLSQQAERVTNVIQYLNKNEPKSPGAREFKLNLVLQNQTLISNGYVALAPFRSEFQITPSQESFQLGSENWIDFLATHEYRHALQNMNFDKGFSHFMRILFGQAGQSFATDMAVPNWFWEGDAVFMETALGQQGRGRLPAFYDQFRELYFDQKNYSWLKIRNGSLKDEVPDYYHLGYLLCAYGREKFGDTLWQNVTNDAVRFKGIIYPFSKSLEKNTGMKMISFYHAMLQYYGAHWTADSARTIYYPVKNITIAKKHFITREYPVFISKDSLLFLQYSYKKTPALCLMDSGKKIIPLVKQDIVLENYFSYNAHKIVWIGYRFDSRWGWKDFGVLRLYDMDQKKLITLSHRTKYFSPDISHDGKKIIVLQTTPDQQYALVLLNAANGKIIRRLDNPNQYYYTYPKFDLDDQSVFTSVRNKKGEMALMQQWLYKDSSKICTPFSYKVTGIPLVTKDNIFFTASYHKVNNVYALNRSSGAILQVTDEKYGAYQPAVNADKSKLIFSEFSIYGNQLKQTNLDTNNFKKISGEDIQKQHNFYVQKALQREGGPVLNRVPENHFSVSKYPQTAHLINIHSWEPIISDPNYGIQILSDNILNTLSSSLFYQYNRNEYSHSIGLNAVYGGLYPEISIGGNYTFNRSGVTSQHDRIYWNEAAFTVASDIPWNFSANKYYRFLTIGAGWHNNTVHYLPNSKYELKDFTINYASAGISFSQQLIKAQQNIFSHFRQDISAQYSHSLRGRHAQQWQVSGDFYFPGFFVNHNIVLQAAYLKKDTANQYSFTDNFIYARGYSAPYYASIYKLGANYHFPILYPDIGAGGIVYALRIRGNIFYDYSRTTFYENNITAHEQFRSAGAELFFDTKWWNEYPVTIGLRFSHLLDNDPSGFPRKNVWEVIVPLQLL